MFAIDARKTLILSSIIVTLIAAAALVWRAWPHANRSIRGEVVETYCFTTGNEQGAAHAACGIQCAKRGIPIALFDALTRTTYVLLPSRDKAPLPPELIAAMGRQVTVRGDVIKRGGSTFLTVQSFAAD
jgi:hypothetical protein